MNLFKSKTAKVFAGLVTLALVLTFVLAPATTKAATAEELAAQIAMLTAQIAALTGGGSMTGSAYVYNTDLTIGSTGADVTALQTKLQEAGFLTMPSGVAKGYFGSLTASGVKAWQASAGLPATGFFGPLSRAKANATWGGSTTGGNGVYPAGCSSTSGFSSTTGMPCSSGTSFPAGCTSSVGFSTTTGMSCASGTGTTMNGTDGSVTLSYVSYAPASQTLKKGDMAKPVVSVKLQAVNGQVAVTRFDVHFSERPWLIFGKLTLTDSTGAVLATKVLSGASDATEVTVGSDYLVRFDGVNVNVTPGSDKILAVALDVLAASDKITGQTVYVGIPSGSIRTINGKGYTDSIGLSTGVGSGVTSSTGNAVTLSSSGSTATAYTRIDPSSPANDRTIVTSASQTTPNQTLGVFGIKLQNQGGTLNSLSFNINNSTGAATSTLYSNLRVQIGGQTYGSNNPIAGNTTFTNMSVPLAVDVWTPVTLIADVNTNQTGISASSTLVGASIGGVDSNFNTITVTSASNQTSANNIYSLTGVNVSAPSVLLGSCTGGNQTYINNTCPITLAFTVTNVGNSDIYLSRTPAIALSTTTLVNGVASAVASSTLSTINIGLIAGDGGTSGTSYIVTSQGTRTFTYQGAISKNAAGGAQLFKITAVKFGTTTTNGAFDATLNAQTLTAGTNSGSMVNYGLESLSAFYQFPVAP